MTFRTSRRSILRTGLRGATAALALPLLDCFLNDNGTALAAGAPLPVRFGTWFWGCGINPTRWAPKTAGTGYEITPELEPIRKFRDQVNVFTNFDVVLDSAPNMAHISGNMGFRTGAVPGSGADLPSLDVLISDSIGSNVRFRSLDVTCTGDVKHSYSQRSSTQINPPEISPLALYTRIFGPDFKDPNAATFTPDPKVRLRQSILSEVGEDRKALLAQVGASDQARLDQYFTSLRQVEQQLAMQLQKPPPAVACVVPGKPKDMAVGTEIEQVIAAHKLMADLIAMALACNQTKAFNVVFSDSSSSLRRIGANTTHHQLTHEEVVDEKLGYQPQVGFYVQKSMEAWGGFIETLASIREGDGTLLDNCLVLAHSDTSLAKNHSIQGLPVMTAGRCGGRLKTGIHKDGNGSPATQIGYTAMMAMGLTVDRWGKNSLQTNKSLTDILT